MIKKCHANILQIEKDKKISLKYCMSWQAASVRAMNTWSQHMFTFMNDLRNYKYMRICSAYEVSS
jgi:hypothetical protein